MTKTSTANPCASSCPRGRWSASERRAMQPGRLDVLAQMIEGPWNNDACKGYAILAMERAGLDPEMIRKVSSAMTDCFDDTTVAEAGRYYVKGVVR